jgi:hypothetical protein
MMSPLEWSEIAIRLRELNPSKFIEVGDALREMILAEECLAELRARGSLLQRLILATSVEPRDD